MITGSIASDSIIAIGDIHGCHQALEGLLKVLLPLSNKVVFLGDYVDRGPSSPRVIGLLIAAKLQRPDWIFLMGNHELMLLQEEDGQVEPFQDDSGYSQYWDMDGIPSSHRNFLNSLDFYHESTSFLFIHGGIEQGIHASVDDYEIDELLWTYKIDRGWKGKTIVRGHQVVEEPSENSNHISIDTGCCFGGWLSAAVLDDSTGRLLSAIMIRKDGSGIKFWTESTPGT